MKYAVGEEKRKALAAALRENLKRRKAQARGRMAGHGAPTDHDADSASQAGAPTDAMSDPRKT